eukprot:RCo020508
MCRPPPPELCAWSLARHAPGEHYPGTIGDHDNRLSFPWPPLSIFKWARSSFSEQQTLLTKDSKGVTRFISGYSPSPNAPLKRSSLELREQAPPLGSCRG